MSFTLYCNVDDKALLGNDPASEATDFKQCLCKQVSTIEPKMFPVWLVRQLYNSTNHMETTEQLQNSNENRTEQSSDN
jgi:hypothetical protein